MNSSERVVVVAGNVVVTIEVVVVAVLVEVAALLVVVLVGDSDVVHGSVVVVKPYVASHLAINFPFQSSLFSVIHRSL